MRGLYVWIVFHTTTVCLADHFFGLNGFFEWSSAVVVGMAVAEVASAVVED